MRNGHRRLNTSIGIPLLALAVLVLVGCVSRQDSIEKYTAKISRYCGDCHNDIDLTANLSLKSLDLGNVPGHRETWEKVIRKLRAGMMPPPGKPRPEWDDYVALTEWLENEIDSVAKPQPGSVQIHRLNRVEYANVVDDLLGIKIDPTLYLPADTSGHGFDNQAASLTISPTLLEAYTTAAGRIARMAAGFWKTPTEQTYIAPADTSQNQQLPGMPFNTRGGMVVEHTFPGDGDYTFYIQNFGLGSFIPGEKLELSIDGKRVHLFDYTGVGLASGMGGDRDGALKVTIPVKAGTRQVGATFLATQYRPDLGLVQQYARKSIENNDIPQIQYHPAIGMLRISGPFNPRRSTDTESRDKIFVCHPETGEEEIPCATKIFSVLARKAYRRPVTKEDVETLMGFYRKGRSNGSFSDGIELGLRRLLVDPEFLVRAETVPAELKPGETYRITDLELASRLSFFLWSTIPDDELLELASQGRLSDPVVLEQQVKRMLVDPRSEALVKNFAEQWLYLRNLPTTSPNGIYYPDWDDELRQSYKQETEHLFQYIIQQDKSIVDLLDADYTFVNERLAKAYGIPGIYGSRFRKVELGPELDYRRGILGKGSFLSVTWTENFRTSPVKRGVWVLENILGTPPPKPPAVVPALELSKGVQIHSVREQMELHRKNPTCAACHRIMGGIGFALENFDADGKWRDMAGHPRKYDGKATPINAKVELWDGRVVNGPSELREALLRYTPQFVRFAVEKLMTYGVGRGVEYTDMPQIRSIVNEAKAHNYSFSSLVLGVIESPQFQMRVKQAEASNNEQAQDPATVAER